MLCSQDRSGFCQTNLTGLYHHQLKHHQYAKRPVRFRFTWVKKTLKTSLYHTAGQVFFWILSVPKPDRSTFILQILHNVLARPVRFLPYKPDRSLSSSTQAPQPCQMTGQVSLWILSVPKPDRSTFILQILHVVFARPVRFLPDKPDRSLSSSTQAPPPCQMTGQVSFYLG